MVRLGTNFTCSNRRVRCIILHNDIVYLVILNDLKWVPSVSSDRVTSFLILLAILAKVGNIDVAGLQSCGTPWDVRLLAILILLLLLRTTFYVVLQRLNWNEESIWVLLSSVLAEFLFYQNDALGLSGSAVLPLLHLVIWCHMRLNDLIAEFRLSWKVNSFIHILIDRRQLIHAVMVSKLLQHCVHGWDSWFWRYWGVVIL